MADLLRLTIFVGMVSKAAAATADPVAELSRTIAETPTPNVDETRLRQAGKQAWLWFAVVKGMTLFRIDTSRGAAALRQKVGEAIAR